MAAISSRSLAPSHEELRGAQGRPPLRSAIPALGTRREDKPLAGAASQSVGSCLIQGLTVGCGGRGVRTAQPELRTVWQRAQALGRAVQIRTDGGARELGVLRKTGHSLLAGSSGPASGGPVSGYHRLQSSRRYLTDSDRLPVLRIPDGFTTNHVWVPWPSCRGWSARGASRGGEGV
ncbi:hypothetical protein VTN00DRAFT_3951 [Thermoascus crustaceus]|uniref:uncharacterized protein n=1 Tax=Thermoascus crustaceus TaxID=5088 RepID=UPI003743F6BE